MAKSEVYARWSFNGNKAVKKDDGNAWDYKNSGGWGCYGEGSSTLGQHTAHAERQAWKNGWPKIRTYAQNTVSEQKAKFPEAFFQVKFVVDQQVCPSCQRWMVIEVLMHLKQLKDIKVIAIAYAEVHTAGTREWFRIGRDSNWPKEVGQIKGWDDLLALPAVEHGVKA
jgi:hypothetical protein